MRVDEPLFVEESASKELVSDVCESQQAPAQLWGSTHLRCAAGSSVGSGAQHLQRLSTISGVFPLAEEALISPGGTTSPEATQHKSVSAPKGIAAMETIAETTMQLILESRKVPKELRLD